MALQEPVAEVVLLARGQGLDSAPANEDIARFQGHGPPPDSVLAVLREDAGVQDLQCRLAVRERRLVDVAQDIGIRVQRHEAVGVALGHLPQPQPHRLENRFHLVPTSSHRERAGGENRPG